MSDKHYKRFYCYGCGTWAVICPTCGNNSCNGGRGKLENGEGCPDCDRAYELMMNDSLLMALPKYQKA